MAHKGACGWETIDVSEAVASGGAGLYVNECDLSGEFVHTGWGALAISGDGSTASYFEWQPTSNDNGAPASIDCATLWLKIWIYFEVLPASGNPETFLSIRNATNRKLYLTIGSDGITHVRDGLSSLLADGTAVVTAGAWHLLRVKCGTGTSGAPFEVQWGLNGATPVTDCSGTGNLGSGNIDRVCFGNKERTGSAAFKFLYDDMACDDAEYPVDIRISVFSPSANGHVNGWTGPGGYTKVYDNPSDGDSTYRASTNTSGTTADQYVTSSMDVQDAGDVDPPPADAVIFGLLFAFRARSTSGTNPTLQYGLTIPNVGSLLTGNNVPGTAYAFRALFADVNPQTTEPWTHAEVDAVETCILDTFTSPHTFRCTTHYKMVYWYLAPQTVDVDRISATASAPASTTVPASATADVGRLDLQSSVPASEASPSPTAIAAAALVALVNTSAVLADPAVAEIGVDGLVLVVTAPAMESVPASTQVDVDLVSLSAGVLSPEVIPAALAALLDALSMTVGTFVVSTDTPDVPQSVTADLGLLTFLAIARAVTIYGGVLTLPDGRTVRVAKENRRASIGGENRFASVAGENRFVTVQRSAA